MSDTTSAGWAPAACTLPTAERPLRVAEFDSLFADAIRAVERVSATQLTVLLAPAPGRVDLVRELTRRETECCSFFIFTLTDGDPLRLEVTVPPAHVDVLDALTYRPRGRPVTHTGLRTSQVADAAGINVQTLRYYERRGLVQEPERTLGGHRVYPPETVTVLRVIKAAQRLGFSLDEVADLLEAGRRRGRTQGLQARAREKLVEVEQRIADLVTIRDNLTAALDAGCDDLHECARQDCCPIPFVPLAEMTVNGT